ncbi:MAG: type II secretion system protein [Chloroflexi bacterium]|nr:type II secretion system protein [Chloroflexota bacterium]
MRKILFRQRGFTLVEILIAVGILAILAAVAVPTVAKFMSRSEIKAASAELSNIQTATDSMMSDREQESVTVILVGAATCDMSVFSDATYKLNGDATYGDYVRQATTRYEYYVADDGDVSQGAKC